MGGERREMEIVDFPRLKKRLFVKGKETQVTDWGDLKALWK